MFGSMSASVLQRFQRLLAPKLLTQRVATCQVLGCSTSSKPTEGETRLQTVLHEKFPDAEVQVVDISGGCGSMYEIYVTSSQFKGVPTVKQHRLVQQALKEEIKDMHGLRVFTESSK